MDGYKISGGKDERKSRKIFEFVKARLKATGGRGKEKALEAAMERFDVADRATIQRKIAPFVLAEKTVRECMEILASGAAPYEGITARMSVLYTKDEIAELRKISPLFVLKLVAEREELERLRRRLPQVTVKVCRK